MAQQRIQKVLSDQGVCSRRAAEKLIDEGRVKVNGHPVTLGDKMDPDFDKVSIDGKNVRVVRKRQYIYLMLNKPRGYLTTASDERGRKTVMELVSDIPANRLPQLAADDMFLTGNVDALREALRRKLANTQPRTYDLTPYNWDNIARQTVDVYLHAIEG